MRNTYGDTRIPNNNNQNQRNLNNSKQRVTYTANHRVQSMQKHGNTVNTNEKMTKKIIQVLKTLSFDGRYSISTTLKPNQKTLIHTIAHFLNSIDDKFQPSKLEIDMLIDLFKMLGYPNNINKTYFQPVGAPHTWSHCLQMMQWLAQLASLNFHMNMQISQAQIDQDITQIMIESYLQNKPKLPRQYLQKDIFRIQKQLESVRYTIESKQLAIKNLHSKQKDIYLMEEQQKKLQGILFREQQEVISSDQKVQMIMKQISQIEKQIEDQNRIKLMDEKDIQNLEKQIKNQELSVQEVDKISQEIKSYREKIINLKNIHQKQCQQFDKTNDNITNSFRQFSNFIQQIDSTLSKGKIQIQKRNIYLNLPQQDFNSLIQFIKNKKQERTVQHIQQMMGTNCIKQTLQKQSILISILDNEKRNLDMKRQNLLKENQELMKFNYDKQIACKEQERILKMCQSQNNKHKSQQFSLQRQNSSLLFKQNQLQNKFNEDRQNHAKLMVDLRKINEQIKEDSQFLNAFQVKSQQIIQKMVERAQEAKQKMIEMMIDQRDYFKNLNDSLNQQRMSQNQKNSQMKIKKRQKSREPMEIQN